MTRTRPGRERPVGHRVQPGDLLVIDKRFAPAVDEGQVNVPR